MTQEKIHPALHPTRTHRACSTVCGAHYYILRTFSSTSHLDMLKLHRQESAAAHYQRKRARSNGPNNVALSHILSAMHRSLPPAATVVDITRMEATAAAQKNVARGAWSHGAVYLARSSQGRNNLQAWSLRHAPGLPQCLVSVGLSAT
jgi:hypothetical protein